MLSGPGVPVSQNVSVAGYPAGTPFLFTAFLSSLNFETEKGQVLLQVPGRPSRGWETPPTRRNVPKAGATPTHRWWGTRAAGAVLCSFVRSSLSVMVH